MHNISQYEDVSINDFADELGEREEARNCEDRGEENGLEDGENQFVDKYGEDGAWEEAENHEEMQHGDEIGDDEENYFEARFDEERELEEEEDREEGREEDGMEDEENRDERNEGGAEQVDEWEEERRSNCIQCIGALINFDVVDVVFCLRMTLMKCDMS